MSAFDWAKKNTAYILQPLKWQFCKLLCKRKRAYKKHIYILFFVVFIHTYRQKRKPPPNPYVPPPPLTFRYLYKNSHHQATLHKVIHWGYQSGQRVSCSGERGPGGAISPLLSHMTPPPRQATETSKVERQPDPPRPRPLSHTITQLINSLLPTYFLFNLFSSYTV